MKMTILSPGPLTTVQDQGRFGYMNTGFSPGGAMDPDAMKRANLLVGNRLGEGVLEMTLMGITAEFDCDTVIGITGADMCPTVNGEPVNMNTTVYVKKGSRLTLGAAKSGMRAYLAVSGGFALEPVMGSLSTNLKCALGGFQGRKLAAGDEICLKRETAPSQISPRFIAAPNLGGRDIALHVILGPQDDYFTSEGIDSFCQKAYTVSVNSDRMGIRLEGERIENKNGVDIISDGIVTGSVQIPPAGVPIIMMADRQTTGGYAKIATVIRRDLSLLAQARPGDRVRFYPITEEMALLTRKEESLKERRLTEKYQPLF